MEGVVFIPKEEGIVVPILWRNFFQLQYRLNLSCQAIITTPLIIATWNFVVILFIMILWHKLQIFWKEQ